MAIIYFLKGLIICLVCHLTSEETCRMKMEKVDCSEKGTANLFFSCISDLSEKECLCVFENPLLTDLGWLKMCKTKQDLKISKKRIHKRQIRFVDKCGSIQPPRPGKAYCSLSPTEVVCKGKCDYGYRFSDMTKEQYYHCYYREGIWIPKTNFPDCEPECIPECENGGTCIAPNICTCTNKYRGERCQYSIDICSVSKNSMASHWNCKHTRTETICDISCKAPGESSGRRHVCGNNGLWFPPLPACVQATGRCAISKNMMASNWKCKHTRSETICNVSCKAPGTQETDADAQRHFCDMDGIWSPPLPPCVQGSNVCVDPGNIPLCTRSPSSVSRFKIGDSVVYECEKGYEMSGNAKLVCQTNGKWVPEKPKCVPIQKRQQSLDLLNQCPRPNAPMNSLVSVTFPDQGVLRSFFASNESLIHRLYFTLTANNTEGEDLSYTEGIFVVGTRVQYKCKSKFYKLYGSEYQTCQPTHTWSGYQPACVPECGKTDSPKTPYIVNGEYTNVGQWPWMVAIGIKTVKGLQLICGGALVSESFAVTAAHCVTKPNSNKPMDPRNILVYCGKFYRSFSQDDEYVQIKQIRQIIINDEYDFINYDGDIALLKLEDPVELTTRVKPICLPSDVTTRENIRDGKEGMVIGWGITENGSYSETIRETVLPVVSHDRCEEAYREGLRTITITKNMFCAGHDSGSSDTCSGDSGGPYMFSVGPSNDNHWYLEGLVSWGSKSGCGKAQRYSGFTKVEMFVSWINMFI